MSASRLKILILGGYGTFGGRLARLLAEEPRLTLLIAGRSAAKAAAFCEGLPRGAETVPLAFDRDGDLEGQIGAIAPDLVVDATGPFQAYGDDAYRVVASAIRHGACYMDLADGSAFVRDIVQFDGSARARGVFVLAGVSSFPVLTAAVVRELSRDLAHVDAIEGGIAPSPYAGVGLNVIRAIAGYAGRPVRLVRDGRACVGYALTDTRRATIAPPGRLPLRNIRFSLVDVPDLQVLPGLWPDLRSVWMGAGPVPGMLHRALSGLAWLVRLRLLPSLAALAPMFHGAINRLRWGEHRGGMFVAVAGRTGDGRPVARSWHLLAEGDDGPFIPSMTVAALVRRWLSGQRPEAGARPATRELELSDYASLFAQRAIFTGVREAPARPDGTPLYQRLLGEAWQRLPAPVRALHDNVGDLTTAGRAEVERGTGVLARLVAAVFRFPKDGRGIPVTVAFEARRGREAWRRSFAGRSFASEQWEGEGRFERLLCERFGPFVFGLGLVAAEHRLAYVVRRWTCLGLPLPLFLAPGGTTFEHAQGDRFRFHVEIAHPLTGLIVRYRGWLAPDGPGRLSAPSTSSSPGPG